MGNQIKSKYGFPSVDFDNMPGPFVGNVTSGPVTRQYPSVDPFNLIF